MPTPADLADAQSLARDGAPGTHPEWDRLVRTIWRLRQPDGCPWDRTQTHESIARDFLEETYEAVDAINAGDVAHLREELGDVLMQVLLHAQIEADAGGWDVDDVCRDINDKLVRRHPHVFGDLSAATADDVLGIWDTVKAAERASAKAAEGASAPKPEVVHVLDGVTSALPALMEAQKVSRKAAKRGFEWDTTADVWAKVDEERAEFEAEPTGSPEAELEFGDLLFALVNVARKEGIDAEAALRKSTAKFRRRWAAMEDTAAERGEALDAMGASVSELERLWGEAKRRVG